MSTLDFDKIREKHLTHVTRGKAPEPVPESRPPSPPKLDAAAIKDNLRRLKFPVFATTDALGRTTYVHDPGVVRDGLLANTRTDRGEGVVSADVLSKEQAPKDAPSAKPRDSSGKFTSEAKETDKTVASFVSKVVSKLGSKDAESDESDAPPEAA